jgi:hypothetical protein
MCHLDLRPIEASTFVFVSSIRWWPPFPWAPEASVTSHVAAIMLEIIKCEGLSVSPCVQRLTTPDDARGPSSLGLRPTSSQTQRNSVCMMVLRGGGAFGARPPACVPNKCQIALASGHTRLQMEIYPKLCDNWYCTKTELEATTWPTALDRHGQNISRKFPNIDWLFLFGHRFVDGMKNSYARPLLPFWTPPTRNDLRRFCPY